MDSKLIVFSMDATDEHIGVIESETDTHYIINHVFTFAKQYDASGKLTVNVVPFVLNSCGIKKITIMKTKIAWFTEEMEESFKQQFLASLSGIVVAGADTMNKLKKNNIVDLQSFKK